MSAKLTAPIGVQLTLVQLNTVTVLFAEVCRSLSHTAACFRFSKQTQTTVDYLSLPQANADQDILPQTIAYYRIQSSVVSSSLRQTATG